MNGIDKENLDDLKAMAHCLRFLCADMVQEANSGHPGVAMGLADVAVVLGYHLKINPRVPNWINRDRVVFSGGHASSLVYALLHLWGFDLSLEDLKKFRKKDSKTPGHPEYGHTQGVEITTGPLGQGVANAVGFAMAAKYAREHFGKMISHKIYCFCGDGDLQEGISYEACSLAGHHQLKDLILIYDCNSISIEGDIQISMSEDIQKRFEAQGFLVLRCDGHNFCEIDEAVSKAKESSLPVLIIAHTKIGRGAVGLEGSAKTHGSPLGEEVIKESKRILGFDQEKKFVIPSDVKFRFENIAERGEMAYRLWEKENQDYQEKIRTWNHIDFDSIDFPVFKKGEKIATRVSNGKILNAIAQKIPGFLGGSADLGPSNNTVIQNSGDFPKGKNLHFGIREHSMGAITNAIANYGLFLPYCATFFVFSDYLSPSIRIASLMKSKVFYIFTHDSIGVGEDGATHQPVEQLSHFRAMPNLVVFRPADANENIACFKQALKIQAPCMFVLSRQNLEVLSDRVPDVEKGAYILKDNKNAKITLLATGSEVSLAVKASEKLEDEGIAVRVVSVPSFDLLNQEPKSYLDALINGTKVLAIEAARSFEWYKIADDALIMDSFGASAKGEELFELYGFSVENILKRAKALL